MSQDARGRMGEPACEPACESQNVSHQSSGPKRLRVAAIVLAAGRSTRMGAQNKLLLPYRGAALILHAVDAVLAAGLTEVVVVTGHDAEAVSRVLASRAVSFAHNSQFELGLATSLRTGVRALRALSHGIVERGVVERGVVERGVVERDGALICLGDMPAVRSQDIRALITAFEGGQGREICVPMRAGQRGNPVLWPAIFFEELCALSGDMGGRRLLEANASCVRCVEVDSEGVLLDIDTPDELER